MSMEDWAIVVCVFCAGLVSMAVIVWLTTP
jgi:hypothetical protein